MRIVAKNSNLVFTKPKTFTASIIGNWRNGDSLADGISAREASFSANRIWGVGLENRTDPWDSVVGKIVSRMIVYSLKEKTYKLYVTKDGLGSDTLLGTVNLKKGMNSIDLSSYNHVMQKGEHIGLLSEVNSDIAIFATTLVKYKHMSKDITTGSLLLEGDISTLMDFYFTDAE